MCKQNIRQKASEQSPQPFLKEPFGFHENIEIEPIAVELCNSTSSDYDALGVAVLDNVQGEQQSINKSGCQSVVRG